MTMTMMMMVMMMMVVVVIVMPIGLRETHRFIVQLRVCVGELANFWERGLGGEPGARAFWRGPAAARRIVFCNNKFR